MHVCPINAFKSFFPHFFFYFENSRMVEKWLWINDYIPFSEFINCYVNFMNFLSLISSTPVSKFIRLKNEWMNEWMNTISISLICFCMLLNDEWNRQVFFTHLIRRSFIDILMQQKNKIDLFMCENVFFFFFFIRELTSLSLHVLLTIL